MPLLHDLSNGKPCPAAVRLHFCLLRASLQCKLKSPTDLKPVIMALIRQMLYRGSGFMNRSALLSCLKSYLGLKSDVNNALPSHLVLEMHCG